MLKQQAWLQDAPTRALLSAFGDVPLRFVGGCVRDAVMNRTVGDIDCATPAAPNAVLALLEQAGIKAVPTGIAHGTITAIINSRPFEITTLRRDVACDGRHAEVAYTDDWQEDAMRRDFTLNALYCDADGNIYDYTNGIEAARNGQIHFIGDAAARISEDALRILRFFRFCATHGNGEIDMGAVAACQEHKQLLNGLSGERIQQEMFKLFAADDAYASVKVMQNAGILSFLLGETVIASGFNFRAAHPLLRLALLLPDEAAAQKVSDRWKLSNHDRALLLLLRSHPYEGWPDNEYEILRVARHLPIETYRLLLQRNALLLSVEPQIFQKVMSQLTSLKMPVFPVTGNDLITKGIQSGPQMGKILRQLEHQWEKSSYQLTKEALLKSV